MANEVMMNAFAKAGITPATVAEAKKAEAKKAKAEAKADKAWEKEVSRAEPAKAEARPAILAAQAAHKAAKAKLAQLRAKAEAEAKAKAKAEANARRAIKKMAWAVKRLTALAGCQRVKEETAKTPLRVARKMKKTVVRANRLAGGKLAAEVQQARCLIDDAEMLFRVITEKGGAA